jgi:hypothetical protein
MAGTNFLYKPEDKRFLLSESDCPSAIAEKTDDPPAPELYLFVISQQQFYYCNKYQKNKFTQSVC